MTKWTKGLSFVALLPVFWSGIADAADPPAQPMTPAAQAAQQHFTEAMNLFQQGEIDHACTLFDQSYREGSLPGTLFNLSVCREKQGRFAEAYAGFDELATRAEEAHHPDQAKTARARADALIPKLARIDLVHRADARSEVTSISVDTTVFASLAYKKPIYVLPGTHTILIKHADGTNVTRKSNALAAGAAQSIEMEDPAPLPDAPLGPNATAPLVLREETVVNKKQRTAAFVVGGIGAGFAVVGGVFGILAVNKRTQASNACPGGSCSQDDVDRAYSIRGTGKRDATFSDVGIGVGLGAIAGAVLLYVTASHKETGDVPASAMNADKSSTWRFTPTGDAHGGGGLLQASF